MDCVVDGRDPANPTADSARLGGVSGCATPAWGASSCEAKGARTDDVKVWRREIEVGVGAGASSLVEKGAVGL